MQEFLLGSNEYESFNKHGFLVLRHFAPKADLEALQALAQQHLANPQPPLELEAAVGYPGAPTEAGSEGSNTVRRQLGAYARHPLFKAWATQPAMVQGLQTLFGNTQVFLSQAHHNCLMTKSPAFSSDTGWHQDIRYWSFQQPQLITAWLALGEEDARNGGLKIIPGSHRTAFNKEQFDENLFFRADLPENKTLIDQAIEIKLAPGDVLFFHCNLLHCASRNYTDTPKLALVFTYRDSNNAPLVNTRSASQPEIALAPAEPAPPTLSLGGPKR